MTLLGRVRLRRSAMCAAVGAAIVVGLGPQAVSAAPAHRIPGTASGQHQTARWHADSAVTAAVHQSTSAQAGWRVIYSAHTRVTMYLTAVEAISSHEAWAVGYGQTGNAVALHWIRGRWRGVPIPAASQFFPQYVAASSPQDVWVFGYRNTATGQPWQALRWDGHRWHEMPQPPDPGVTNEVGFLVLGPSNVWFPSQSSCQTTGAKTCSTPVCRWNGTSWVVYNLSSNVTGLAASGPRNIWAVGYRLRGRNRNGPIARPVVYHWSGTAFRAIGMPTNAVTGFGNGGPVIDTSGPRDVWIGSGALPTGDALLMHWNGRRWHGYGGPVIGGTAVIDSPIGVWTSPWGYWTGRTWQSLNIPTWMNAVYYLARVPRSETMLAAGGTDLSKGRFRGEIFAYGKFG